MKKKNVDVATLINKEMWKIAKLTTGKLYFPALITGLCLEAGVVIGRREPQTEVGEMINAAVQTRITKPRRGGVRAAEAQQVDAGEIPEQQPEDDAPRQEKGEGSTSRAARQAPTDDDDWRKKIDKIQELCQCLVETIADNVATDIRGSVLPTPGLRDFSDRLYRQEQETIQCKLNLAHCKDAFVALGNCFNQFVRYVRQRDEVMNANFTAQFYRFQPMPPFPEFQPFPPKATTAPTVEPTAEPPTAPIPTESPKPHSPPPQPREPTPTPSPPQKQTSDPTKTPPFGTVQTHFPKAKFVETRSSAGAKIRVPSTSVQSGTSAGTSALRRSTRIKTTPIAKQPSNSQNPILVEDTTEEATPTKSMPTLPAKRKAERVKMVVRKKVRPVVREKTEPEEESSTTSSSAKELPDSPQRTESLDLGSVEVSED